MKTAMQLSCFLLAMTLGATQEPAPEMYTTTMEPEPNGTTATTTPTPVHAVNIQMALSNISAITSEAELLSSLTASLKTASGGSSGSNDVTVNITIEHITVTSVFKNLPEIITDSIVDAYHNMTGIAKANIAVNNEYHSQHSGGRRLAADAEVAAKVTKSANPDVVAKTQSVVQATSLTAMATALAAANPTKYANVASQMTFVPPTTQLSVKTIITGATSAPTENAIKSELATNVPGGANVSSLTVTDQTPTVVMSTTTTNVDDSGAPIFSLITGWLVCFGLLML